MAKILFVGNGENFWLDSHIEALKKAGHQLDKLDVLTWQQAKELTGSLQVATNYDAIILNNLVPLGRLGNDADIVFATKVAALGKPVIALDTFSYVPAEFGELGMRVFKLRETNPRQFAEQVDHALKGTFPAQDAGDSPENKGRRGQGGQGGHRGRF